MVSSNFTSINHFGKLYLVVEVNFSTIVVKWSCCSKVGLVGSSPSSFSAAPLTPCSPIFRAIYRPTSRGPQRIASTRLNPWNSPRALRADGWTDGVWLTQVGEEDRGEPVITAKLSRIDTESAAGAFQGSRRSASKPWRQRLELIVIDFSRSVGKDLIYEPDTVTPTLLRSTNVLSRTAQWVDGLLGWLRIGLEFPAAIQSNRLILLGH